MGIITDFYVAPRSAADALLAGKTAKLKTLAAKSIESVKLTSLEEIAARVLKAKGKVGKDELLTDEASEQWVFLVSPRLVTLLAKAGGKTAAIAKAWAATEELESDKIDARRAKVLVDALVALAVEAQKTKSDLLLFMSL